MSSATERVSAAARELKLEVAVVAFEQPTRTAEDAAAAIGCDVGQIVKSLLFLADGAPVMALVSGANRLHEGKLARLCGVGRKKVRRADADTTRAVTGFAIGGVAPFGHPQPLPVYVDADLMQYETVWAAAGTPNTVFAVSPADLLRVTDGNIVDLKQD
ncbi:MAG: YbaK/EbsC family protein [Anaerolineales bacterium]